MLPLSASGPRTKRNRPPRQSRPPKLLRPRKRRLPRLLRGLWVPRRPQEGRQAVHPAQLPDRQALLPRLADRQALAPREVRRVALRADRGRWQAVRLGDAPVAAELPAIARCPRVIKRSPSAAAEALTLTSAEGFAKYTGKTWMSIAA